MNKRRYTIRGLPVECIERLRDVRDASGVPIGVLVNDAVEQWWNALPIEMPVAPPQPGSSTGC
jgi:hypothetical protein